MHKLSDSGVIALLQKAHETLSNAAGVSVHGDEALTSARATLAKLFLNLAMITGLDQEKLYDDSMRNDLDFNDGVASDPEKSN